jgi:predicted nucleic acid-binding protein
MTALVDINVLVYRFDPRNSAKQRVARELLREGTERDKLRVPHQAIVEFVKAVTRPLDLAGTAPAACLASTHVIRPGARAFFRARPGHCASAIPALSIT